MICIAGLIGRGGAGRCPRLPDTTPPVGHGTECAARPGRKSAGDGTLLSGTMPGLGWEWHPPVLASRLIGNHLIWWYPSLYLPAAALAVLVHPAVQKLTSTDADPDLGLTTWVIACRLPNGAGGLQPVLVIKVVVVDDLPRPVVTVSDDED